MLQPPPTIRLPRPEEIPSYPEVIELLKARENANIVEGYTFSVNTTNDLPFKFYAEINIDNSSLWSLFIALAHQLPDEVCCIYNLYEEEAIISGYKDKKLILAQLRRYETELTQDSNLEFGLIYHAQNELGEVFVADSKFLKVWGNDEFAFRDLMNEFGLKEIENLNFIDEFPKIVEPLTMFNDKVKSSETVVSELNEFFAVD